MAGSARRDPVTTEALLSFEQVIAQSVVGWPTAIEGGRASRSIAAQFLARGHSVAISDEVPKSNVRFSGLTV